MPRVVDMTGRRSGFLTAIRFLRSDGAGRIWLVRCDCGNEQEMLVKRFTRGDIKSCGCKTSELMTLAHKGKPKAWLRTHGMSDHPAYWVWRSMHDRCRLPTHQAWHNYGARGIRVCKRWDVFKNFWEDMGPTYVSGLTLERKNNNSHYTPKNCIWTTYQVQAENTRRSLPVNMMELQRRTGIGQTTLLYRWHNGLSMTSATPDPDRVSWCLPPLDRC